MSPDGMPPWLDRLAHDLRGPLAPLQTAAHLLRSGALDADRQAELVELVDRQTQCLAGMLDELDDWWRASQGRLLGPAEDCAPDELLAMALESDAALETLPIDPVDDRVAAARLRGDPQRLVQMMREVASFAVARSASQPRIAMTHDGGRVRLDAEWQDADGVVGRAAGLLESPLPDPCDKGLGLRLLIARAIAEAHGGRLVAEQAGERIRLRCELPVD